MTFKFACPNCGQRVSATDELIGTTATCPTCSHSFIVCSPHELLLSSTSTATDGAAGAAWWKSPILYGIVVLAAVVIGIAILNRSKTASRLGTAASMPNPAPASGGIPGLGPPPVSPTHAAPPMAPASPDAIIRKLNTIVFPKIGFRDATVREAVEFLVAKSKDLDPEHVGVNIVLLTSAEGTGGIPGLEPPPGFIPADPYAGIRITLTLNSVPLIEVIKYVTNLADLKFKVEPHHVSIVPLSGSDYFERAKSKTRSGDVDGTIADCTRAIEINPTDCGAYRLRATARGLKGDTNGAFGDCDRAIQINPNDSAAYEIRGTMKGGMGNIAGALADLDRAIALDPNSANAYSMRGLTKFASGNLNGAIVDADRAVELDPANPAAFGNRAGIRRAIGDINGSEADFKRAGELNPK